jgi:DNA-binding transcriptional ArsR family regulator
VTDALLPALASPRRRELLRLCWRDARSAGDLHRALPDVTFGAVSQHLKVLRDAGLVEASREGREHLYRIRLAGLEQVRRELESFWGDGLANLKRLSEQSYRPSPPSDQEQR